MEAMLHQMNCHAIALMQEGRVDEAITLLVRALSIAYSQLDLDPAFAKGPSLIANTSSTTNATSSVTSTLTSVDVSAINNFNYCQEENKPYNMITCASSIFHRAFCIIKSLDENVATTHANPGAPDLGSLIIVILFNVALAFHRLGLQRGGSEGGSRYLIKALQLYGKALSALDGMEGSGINAINDCKNDQWVLLRLAVYMNQASIYADQLIDLSKATATRSQLLALLEHTSSSSFHGISMGELSIFYIEKLRLSLSHYNVAAAA
jgi:tetratricopeptide (TPR) repeat protein